MLPLRLQEIYPGPDEIIICIIIQNIPSSTWVANSKNALKHKYTKLINKHNINKYPINLTCHHIYFTLSIFSITSLLVLKTPSFWPFSPLKPKIWYPDTPKWPPASNPRSHIELGAFGLIWNYLTTLPCIMTVPIMQDR